MPDASGQSIVYILGGRDDDGGSGAVVADLQNRHEHVDREGFEPRVDVYNSNGVGKIGNTLYISGGESYRGGYWHIDGSFRPTIPRPTP